MLHRSKCPSLWAGKPCYYCGAAAEGHDHVVPFAMVGNNTVTVPCCHECNCLLSSKLFANVESKGGYIYLRFKKRYNKVLNVYKRWFNEDLSEFGPNIRNSIMADINKALYAKDRIDYASEHYESLSEQERQALDNYMKTGGRTLTVVI